MSKFDIEQSAGAGTEDVPVTENAPFLKILQSGSAEIKKSHKDHSEKKIDGAKEGDIVFQKTGEVLTQPVVIQILDTRALWAEWRPKESGGGVVTHHTEAVQRHPELKRDGYKLFLGDNELVETIYAYISFEHKGEQDRGLIAFTSTQLRKIRDRNKAMLSDNKKEIEKHRYTGKDGKPLKPVSFSIQYKLTSVAENNSKGDWMGWKIDYGKLLDPTKPKEEALLLDLKESYENVTLPQIASPKSYVALTDEAVDDGGDPF